MKKAKSIQELVSSIIKLQKSSKTKEDKKEDLEFVDFNKSIEKMLTAKTNNKKIEISL